MLKGQPTGNKSYSLDCRQGTDRFCIYERCDCGCHEGKVFHWGRWKSIETRRRHELGVQEPETLVLRGGRIIAIPSPNRTKVRV